MTRDEFVLHAKKEINKRSELAGIDYDPKDLVVANDSGITTVLLRRSRHATYDEQNEFAGFEYRDLAWAEFRKPEFQIDPESKVFRAMVSTPKITLLCPWLVMLRLPDGTVMEGAR